MASQIGIVAAPGANASTGIHQQVADGTKAQGKRQKLAVPALDLYGPEGAMDMTASQIGCSCIGLCGSEGAMDMTAIQLCRSSTSV